MALPAAMRVTPVRAVARVKVVSHAMGVGTTLLSGAHRLAIAVYLDRYPGMVDRGFDVATTSGRAAVNPARARAIRAASASSRPASGMSASRGPGRNAASAARNRASRPRAWATLSASPCEPTTPRFNVDHGQACVAQV